MVSVYAVFFLLSYSNVYTYKCQVESYERWTVNSEHIKPISVIVMCILVHTIHHAAYHGIVYGFIECEKKKNKGKRTVIRMYRMNVAVCLAYVVACLYHITLHTDSAMLLYSTLSNMCIYIWAHQHKYMERQRNSRTIQHPNSHIRRLYYTPCIQ